MKLGVLILLVCAALTAALVFSILVVHEVQAVRERLDRLYDESVRDRLAAYLVGATDLQPDAPKGKRGRRRMRTLLVDLRMNLKGEAVERARDLFLRYGLGDEAAVSFGSRSPVRRAAAAETLGAMGVKRGVDALRSGLRDRHPFVRVACAYALADLGATEALPEIVEALQNEEPGRLIDVLLVFGASASGFAGDRMLESRSAEALAGGAVVLGELGALKSVPALTSHLNSPDDSVVKACAVALGKIGDPVACEPIGSVLLDRSRAADVRVCAASALALLDDPHGARALVRSLCESDWSVRDAAAEGLVCLGDAGMNAVARDLWLIDERGVAHFVGMLDTAGALDEAIVRAVRSEFAWVEILVRACRSGVCAGLERAARCSGPAWAFAVTVLAEFAPRRVGSA